MFWNITTNYMLRNQVQVHVFVEFSVRPFEFWADTQHGASSRHVQSLSRRPRASYSASEFDILFCVQFIKRQHPMPCLYSFQNGGPSRRVQYSGRRALTPCSVCVHSFDMCSVCVHSFDVVDLSDLPRWMGNRLISRLSVCLGKWAIGSSLRITDQILLKMVCPHQSLFLRISWNLCLTLIIMIYAC